jgi:hypothetical protein
MADGVKAKERMGGFLKPSTATRAETPARDKARGSDPVRAIGVGLRQSEAAELGAIAAGLGVPRSGLMAWALRRFLADYRAGRVTLPPLETVTTTRLPR